MRIQANNDHARFTRLACVLLVFLFLKTDLLFAVAPDPLDVSGEDINVLAEPKKDPFEETDPGRINFCAYEVGYGPLRLQSQSPFQSLRFSMRALAPSTIQKGEWELFLSGTLSNVWVNTADQYLLDYETFDSRVSISYGVSSQVKVEIGYGERRVFGGFLDSFIVGFHDTFGIDQDGRDEAQNGDVNVAIQDDEGNSILYGDDNDTISRGLEVIIQHNVTCGAGYLPAFSYALLARQEMAGTGPLDRDKPIDFGISLATSKRFNDMYLYLAAGYFFYGDDRIGGIELKKHQKTGLIAVEWRYRTTQSLLLQFLSSEGQAKDLDSFSDYSYEITLGWKWEMRPRYLLELGLIENVIIYDNSPDLGVHVGLSHRF